MAFFSSAVVHINRHPISLRGSMLSAVVHINHRFPASLCLLFLPHLHANSTGTTGPARILCISPRLPHPLCPTSVERNAEACPPPRLSFSPLQKGEWSGGRLSRQTCQCLSFAGFNDLLFSGRQG